MTVWMEGKNTIKKKNKKIQGKNWTGKAKIRDPFEQLGGVTSRHSVGWW